MKREISIAVRTLKKSGYLPRDLPFQVKFHQSVLPRGLYSVAIKPPPSMVEEYGSDVTLLALGMICEMLRKHFANVFPEAQFRVVVAYDACDDETLERLLSRTYPVDERSIRLQKALRALDLQGYLRVLQEEEALYRLQELPDVAL